MPGIAPKLPLEFDQTDGFRLTKSIKETVQQNLKNLVLTAPGERVMDPEFGVGLRNYLFQQIGEGLVGNLRLAIRNQVKKYMPFISIEDLMINQPDQTALTDDNILRVHIKYRFLPTDNLDSLTINLPQTNY